MPFLLLMGSFLFMLLSPIQTEAAETSKVDFIDGENKVELTDSKTVIAQNDSLRSAISINENGNEIFNRELSAIKVDGIEKVSIDDQQYSIIMYRYNGSSNALFFEVLKLNDTGAESIYISNVYERARINLNKDEISVKYPEYNEGDVMTEPSKIVNQTFSITGNKVEEGNKSIDFIDITKNSDVKNRIFSLNQTNPSYVQISEILTEAALDADIPPEILKAIAFQESGWKQYWGTNDVPDYAKECDIYDGSNVVIGSDCIGIGIMQISDYRFQPEGPAKEEYIHKLKTDIHFNIQEGIKTLDDKWGYGGNSVPTVNDNNSMVIENWYFAILAYNGLLPRNNPLNNAYTAYQEDVFQRIEDYSLLDLNPFPTYKLNPYTRGDGQMRFDNENIIVKGPQHLSSHSLIEEETTYVTVNGLTLRDAPGGDPIGSLNKGTKVTITGSYAADNSRVNHFVWFPIETSSDDTGWVASSYLSPTSLYLDVYELEGFSRYDTSVSIANHGWHWQQPESVVIGRGDVPIDALTGSVLASALDSPLLLTQSNVLTASVEKELDRLKPNKVYILGEEEFAISQEVENVLNEKFGESNVIRIAGTTRRDTAYQIAKEVHKHTNPNEIFITTDDETSSDPLAIAPYAGENGIPILLTKEGSLNEKIQKYINEKGIKKATIIGGEAAISSTVESQLSNMIGLGNVERVYGFTRFNTNTAIVEEYYDTDSIGKLFITQGNETADALSASPLASKLGAPIILTKTDKIPSETNTWLTENITAKPNIYFLGGPVAVSESTREQFIEIIK